MKLKIKKKNAEENGINGLHGTLLLAKKTTGFGCRLYGEKNIVF